MTENHEHDAMLIPLTEAELDQVCGGTHTDTHLVGPVQLDFVGFDDPQPEAVLLPGGGLLRIGGRIRIERDF